MLQSVLLDMRFITAILVVLPPALRIEFDRLDWEDCVGFISRERFISELCCTLGGKLFVVIFIAASAAAETFTILIEGF